MTSSFMGLFIAIVTGFLLYSPQVEKQRVLTIKKPLVITQEKKSPAFFLFQKIHQENVVPPVAQISAGYLSTETVEKIKAQIQVAQATFDRREIASEQDAGFTNTLASTSRIESETESLPLQEPTLSSALESATRVQESQNEPQQSTAAKWATIKGKFELRGVGVIADHKVELKRIEEGQVREVGQIDLRAGLYSIDISSPSGILIAQIKDKNGLIIGEDRQRIVNLQRRGLYFEGPFIKVKNSDVLAANPDVPRSRDSRISEHGSSKKASREGSKSDGLVASLFSGQSQLEDVNGEVSNIARFASSIAQVNDVNLKYRSVVTIRQPGDLSKTPLFSEKWAEAVVDYVSNQRKLQFNSQQPALVIGQVIIDGKPASGVSVVLENQPALEPIYLDNFMIPSAQAQTTSDNGYFMFIALENGAHTIAALRQQQILSSNIFIAEEGAVSFQTIQADSKPMSHLVRTFNAFTGDPVETDLIIPESDEAIQTVQGAVRYRKYSSSGLAHYSARAIGDQYIPVTYFQDARKDYAHIPLIEEAWLATIQNEFQINDRAQSGIIIGFVPENDFDAYILKDGYNKNDTLYFDQKGQIVSEPAKGGGFIMFGVPKGVVEILIQDKNSDRVYSQVFDVKEGRVHAAHFKNE